MCMWKLASLKYEVLLEVFFIIPKSCDLSEGEEIESVNKYREPFAVGQLCSTIFIFFQRFLILTQTPTVLRPVC